VRKARVARASCLAAVLFAACAATEAPPAPTDASNAVAVAPLRATATVAHDPDDPAIWINRQDPSRSLIVGTVKVAAPDGALAVFGLDGGIRQMITGLDRPNNVDIEYGLPLAGVPTDIAVVTERLGRRLRAFAIPPDGGALREVSSAGFHVLVGAPGNEGAPMGIGLYRRPSDNSIFAIVSPVSHISLMCGKSISRK